jgi:hypothetical protein
VTAVGIARVVVALLLAAAGAGAVVTSAGASPFGRLGGVFAAALLVVVAVGFVRVWRWAYGIAFLLGLFWLWAAIGLGIQGRMSVVPMIVWIAWSVVIMTAAVTART